MNFTFVHYDRATSAHRRFARLGAFSTEGELFHCIIYHLSFIIISATVAVNEFLLSQKSFITALQSKITHKTLRMIRKFRTSNFQFSNIVQEFADRLTFDYFYDIIFKSEKLPFYRRMCNLLLKLLKLTLNKRRKL